MLVLLKRIFFLLILTSQLHSCFCSCNKDTNNGNDTPFINSNQDRIKGNNECLDTKENTVESDLPQVQDSHENKIESSGIKNGAKSSEFESAPAYKAPYLDDSQARLILDYQVNLKPVIQCGPLQRIIVREQWVWIYGNEQNRLDLGRDIWNRVFRANPRLQQILTRWGAHDMYSSKFQVFMMNSIGRLDTMLYLLEETDTMTAMLKHYANAQRGQRDRSKLQLFMSILVDILRGRLGRCFDYDAWVACLGVIIDGLEGKIGGQNIFVPYLNGS